MKHHEGCDDDEDEVDADADAIDEMCVEKNQGTRREKKRK